MMWNLSRPTDEMKKAVKGIKLRGHKSTTFLTGEFARKIATKLELDKEKEQGTIGGRKYKAEIKKHGAIDPLSVSSIADWYCPTRRDLYLTRGLNRAQAKECKTWGRVAGPIVEKYMFKIMSEICDSKDYSSLIDRGKGLKATFTKSEKKSILELGKIEGKEGETQIGDTKWFLKLLDYNGRAELALKILNSSLKDKKSLDVENIKLNQEIKPIASEIGIRTPAKPDFIIPDAQIIGDVKTGVNFVGHHQLTCAGYALAYENQNKGAQINWGVVYFFPTRNPSAYVKPITFAQVYIFPIDDSLRRWFLYTRDEAYKIISSSAIPEFPDKTERTHCSPCKFNDFCKENGLEES